MCVCTLEEWALKWQMPLNVSKCQVTHIGVKNPNYSYRLMESVIDEEGDFGIIVNGSRKVSSAILKKRPTVC